MEVALGRKAMSSPIVGMRKLTKKGSPWVSFGWLGVLSAFFSFNLLHKYYGLDNGLYC